MIGPFIAGCIVGFVLTVGAAILVINVLSKTGEFR